MGYVRLLGKPLFPTADDAKTPRCPHGLKDATADPAVVSAWWDRWPSANIGFATGPASGLLVLDIDCKLEDGHASLSALERQSGFQLPHTWRDETPSGGAHVYFRHPRDRAPRNRVRFRPGLDIKAAGGSIAVPPSRRADGVYRWTEHPLATPLAEAPVWLLDVIDPPAAPRPPAPPIRVGSLDRLARYAAAAIDGECRELASMAPNTGRNLRLFMAAARLGELVGAGVLSETVVVDALEGAGRDCGLVQEDGRHAVLASIRSGLNRGIAQPREVA